MGLGWGATFKQVKSFWALKNFKRQDYIGLEIHNSEKQKICQAIPSQNNTKKVITNFIPQIIILT